MCATRITSFAAAEKTSTLVNRRNELTQILDAIRVNDGKLRVVLVRGPQAAEERKEPEGGYGKTRLLEEVLRRARSNDPDFPSKQVFVADLIDLIDIRLHAESNFLRAVRDAFLGSVEFGEYDEAYDLYRRQLTRDVEYHSVLEAAERADRAFLSDYRKNAENRRLVLLLDTAEQLAIVSSNWLLDRDLLTPDDMRASTAEWLKHQIRSNALPNTTLVCAGRGGEGYRFFKEVAETTRTFHGAEALVDVHLEPFNADDTRQYFEVMASDLRQRAAQAADDIALTRLAQAVEEAAKIKDRARVLWLYTGGIPVRLALYAQLLAEGRTIPEQLQWTWKRVVERVKTNDPNVTTPELEEAQWKIEDHFINLLFAPNDSTDLRYRILQTLVRARRGLTAEQIHFVLDNIERVTPERWEGLLDRRRLHEIENYLEQMEQLFLVKRRPEWWELWDESKSPTPGAKRHGLQDEIYRIYAEHMAPGAEPSNDRLRRIWANLPDAEHKRYLMNRQNEQEARQRLYTQLREWIQYQRTKIQTQRRAEQDEDERSLRLANPVEARIIQFTDPGEAARQRRASQLMAERELQLESMYYAILLDPEKGYSEYYMDIMFDKWVAKDEEEDLLVRAEMWRALNDDDALRFVDLKPRRSTLERGETPLLILQRAAQQEDAAGWIRLFALRKDYKRALSFAASIEQAIDRLKEGDKQSRNDWISWRHTFASSSRLCWTKYTEILMGRDLPGAINVLEKAAQDLERLASCTVDEIAIDKSVAPSAGDERGFKGVQDPDTGRIRHHPAYISLCRIASAIHNYIGYACVSLGQHRKAVRHYGRALYFIRETGALAHRANVLNNLSRALSEMGRYRAVRVCDDALELRKQIGEEVRIALSLNTLALIYNDRNRPEDAWPRAATAVAYARRAEELRTLGLSLLQLGEALRRLAGQSRTGQVLPADPDSIYAAAADILKEAHSIFDPEAAGSGLSRALVDEPMRLIEAKIELGCLFRDRIRATTKNERSPQWRSRYQEALKYLEKAAAMAQSFGFGRHALDARVNQAWTHFYAGNTDAAQKTLDAVEQELTRLAPNYFIRPRSPETPDGFAPNPVGLEEFYILPQLSKIYGLRGFIAIEQFNARVDELARTLPGEENRDERQRRVHEDTQAQNLLSHAAEYYTLGTAYAQLYSPRSASLTVLYDRLYDFLKHFNGTELDDFHAFINQHRRRYPIGQIRANIEDLGNLDQFMNEVFGLTGQVAE